MGRYDKAKGRWVSFNEDVEEAAAFGKEMLANPIVSDVEDEQKDWDGDLDNDEPPFHCKACHTEPGTCGHWLGCPEC